VGDSAGHCFPLSGEGIRTAFYFGIACGRELRAVVAGERSRDEALRRYAAFSAGHARAFGLALRLQALVPRVPPLLLTAALKAFGHGPLVERSFAWYLDQASPAYARAPAGVQSRTPSHSLPYARMSSISGTSASPFGVSEYSTRGGTSG
jgi:menaquinone-9 beta-reductase